MNIIQLAARKIISFSFYMAVKFISIFYDMKKYKNEKIKYSRFPKTSIGYNVSQSLIENKLDLIPLFENHDLKHVILNYKMTPVDEIKLQAFMFGNGNHSLACISILFFGLILLPDEWSNLYTEFVKGKNTIPISEWRLSDLAKVEIETINTFLK